MKATLGNPVRDSSLLLLILQPSGLTNYREDIWSETVLEYYGFTILRLNEQPVIRVSAYNNANEDWELFKNKILKGVNGGPKFRLTIRRAGTIMRPL